MYSCSSRKKNVGRVNFLLGILGLLIVGCGQSEPTNVPTFTIERQLIPYRTATKNPTSDLITVPPTDTPKPTNIPAPTSTPLVYQVVENDTLTSIALQNSITLGDLIAANRGIDPNFLTIGMTLTIPLDGVVSAAIPTPTPITIILQPPICYPLIDGSIQCMSIVENNQATAVENVMTMIYLQTTSGKDLVSQIAISPLNIIPAGQKAAVEASFAPPLPSEYVAQARLLSVIPVSLDDPRYLQTDLQIDRVEISLDGQQASVSGTIKIPSEQLNLEKTEASTLWLSAFAYDEHNQIVGIRKWIASDLFELRDRINFELVVYSLGLSIDHVDLLTEARP